MAPNKRYQRLACVLLYRRCPQSMWPCWNEPDGDTFLWGLLFGPPYDFPTKGPYWSTYDAVDDVWWASPEDYDDYKLRERRLTEQYLQAEADAAELADEHPLWPHQQQQYQPYQPQQPQPFQPGQNQTGSSSSSSYITQVYPYPSHSHLARYPPTGQGQGQAQGQAQGPPPPARPPLYGPVRHVTFQHGTGPAGPRSPPGSGGMLKNGSSSGGSASTPPALPPPPTSPDVRQAVARFLPISHPHHPSHMPPVCGEDEQRQRHGRHGPLEPALSVPGPAETGYPFRSKAAAGGVAAAAAAAAAIAAAGPSELSTDDVDFTRLNTNNSGRGGRWTLRIRTDRDDSKIDRVLCRIVVGVVPQGTSDPQIKNMFTDQVPLPRKYASPPESGATWIKNALRLMQDRKMAQRFDVDKFALWAISLADTTFKSGNSNIMADYTMPLLGNIPKMFGDI